MSESGSDLSTRRGLLRVFARNATGRALEVAPMIRSTRMLDLSAIDEWSNGPRDDASSAPGELRQTRRAACAPSRALSVEDLIGLAHTEGFTGRDDELRGLAKFSLRMTSTDPRRATAWILTRDGWVAPGGREVLAAQIDLTAAAWNQGALPREGWLVLFVGSVEAADDAGPRPAHGVGLDRPADPGAHLEPMQLGAELVIPRLWHEAVQALEFDEGEADAYARVRARLGQLQGVEDDSDGGLGIAFHRVLGYPNETTGSMPSDCVRTPPGGSRERERWDLLAQISVDAVRRLYIWIRTSDLEIGRFEQLCAFVR
jgi:hypothetical protein